MPNRATSIPSGTCASSLRPLTWCVSAVGIAASRPGRASPALTISLFFCPKNMQVLLIVSASHIGRPPAGLYSAAVTAAWRQRARTVSLPGAGCRGISSAKTSDTDAIPAASPNTAPGDAIHR